MVTGLDAQHQIFASNPNDRRAFEALEEHYFLDGNWDELVGVYRNRITAADIAGDAVQLAPLLFRLGQILEERILDLDAAAEIYWTLARLDPTNRPALRQLRGIHERGGKWDLVLQIAELESATTMPPYERAAFETELGVTWQRHLGDVDEARKAFERALESDPEFPAALEGLAALHQDGERFEEASQILIRLTEKLRGPERAPVWIALGTLYSTQLGDPDRARECFEHALDDDPYQTPAVEWSLLLATAQEDWSAVSDLLERRFDLASGARNRAAIAVEASQIQLNHLDSPARARAWTDRAVELSADELSVLLAVAEVERSDGDQRALIKTLERVIELAGDRAPRGVLVEVAELRSKLGDSVAALDALRRASKRHGHDDGRVLELQSKLLRESGLKRELAEVLETLCALEGGIDDEHRAGYRRELARIQEEDLGEEAPAEASWQQAFALDSSHREPIAALERIYRKRDDWDALRELLEGALAATEATDNATHRAANGATDSAMTGGPAQSERSEQSARLGTLLLDHFDDAEQARKLFESALAERNECRNALGGLRRVAEKTGDSDLLLDVCEREADGCNDADAMSELARAAIPILEDRGQIDKALTWAMRWSQSKPGSPDALLLRARFQAHLGRIEDEIESRRKLSKMLAGSELGDSLRRQAALHIELGDDAAASGVLELAVEGEPGACETLTSICAVYRRLQRPQELVRNLRLLADQQPPSEQAEYLEEVALVLEDPIGDLDAAIVIRWQLADLPDAPEDAGKKLESLLEMAGRYAELAQLLHTRRQRFGDESKEAFALDVRRGGLLLDSLGQIEEATQIFATLHERHPHNEEILDQLERSLRVGDDAAALCELIERRASWESEPARKSAMHLERAAILEEVLGEPLRAADIYEEIIETGNGSQDAETAQLRLETLLESSGQWQRLRDRLISQIDDLDDQQRATLHERIASICLERLNDIAGAATQLEAIAEVVTDRIHIWQKLGELYAHELNRPADWLRVVEAELNADPTPERELSLRVGAARLLLDDERRPSGRDSAESFAHYQRVLDLEPIHAEAAEVLASHFDSEDRPTETARILECRLTGLQGSDDSEVNDLRLRLATLYATKLDDDERARSLFEEARMELGAALQIAEPLADLYERVGADAELSELCHESISHCEGHAGEHVWRMRLGASEKRCGRLEEAAAAYRRALAASPDDREIEDALIDLYDEIGEIDPLVDLLEKRLPYAGAEEAIALRLRLARLNTIEQDRPAEALAHLESILESHPQHRDAFDQALRLADQIGEPERISALLDRALEIQLPTNERAAILERRGVLLAESLGQPEQAITDLREALALNPDSTTTRQILRRELEKLNRWPAVLDCLFIEANEAQGEERVTLLQHASEIAWSRVGPDASLPWLARLRVERPEDPEIFARSAEVHRRAGRFEAALRAHDEELTLRSEPSEEFALHIQRARLLERELNAPGRAIFAYLNARELKEDDEVLVELDRLYDIMGRPLERAGVLESRLQNLNGAEAIPLRQVLSTLYCVDLARPELALPYLEANVEAVRGDAREELVHLGALDAALRASTRHDVWAQVAERQLEIIEGNSQIHDSTPPEFVHFLREELARTYDVELGATDRALKHIRVLASAQDQVDHRTKDQLRALLRKTGRLAELAASLTELLQAGGRPAGEWLELARLREEKLNDLSGALLAYREAATDPDCQLDAIRGQRRCCERLRDWKGLTDALEAEYRLDTKLDRRQRTTIARTLGTVAWQRLGSGERAEEGYQLALDLDPKDLFAIQSMISVMEACSKIEEVIPLYHRELELLDENQTGRQRRREIWLRLATLFQDVQDVEGVQDARDSTTKAIDAYVKGSELGRLSAPDELRLARLYQGLRDHAAFADAFGRWCDREDSGSVVNDHLELARQHRAEGQAAAALARAERATAVAPESADAWSLLGELQRADDEHEMAAAAFERAGEHAGPGDAANYLVEAAASIEDLDLERAYSILKQACDFDPAALRVHVALARVSNRQSRLAETQYEAETSLELAHGAELNDATRLELAVLGGRAARALDQHEASLRLFEMALEIDNDHIEALEGKADAHYRDGDYQALRNPLERRLELPGENPMRGRQNAMIARCFEAENHLDAAWARYEEAIELDSSVDEAHEGVVRVHERAARPEEALLALERWARHTTVSAQKASASFRAAEHAFAMEDMPRARRCLETATSADPEFAPAWVLLCQLTSELGVDRESRRVCDDALEAIESGPFSAQVSLIAAKLAEISGETAKAIEHYSQAALWEPRFSEAALCWSRLVRMSGDWIEAEAILARFADAHPDPDSPTLAHVQLERGRLLSGPLEKFEEAIDAYQGALTLQPDLRVARTALAGLLLHSSDRWREALSLHRDILESSPTTASSLRAISQLANQRGQTETAQGALAVLRALGLASPQETTVAPDALRVPIHPGPPMADSTDERLRRIAHQLREELTTVLADAQQPQLISQDREVAAAIEQISQIEDELTAPGLGLLSCADRSALFTEIAALFLDPGGNGGGARYRDALDQTLGRWTRRKVRRIFEETNQAAIDRVDHQRWGMELRSIAAAQAIDRNGGNLGAVLRALLIMESDDPSQPRALDAEIATLAANSDPACRLLKQINLMLCERLEQSR